MYSSRSGRNYYGTKRIFTRVYVPSKIYFGSAVYFNYLCTNHTNPPFQNFSGVKAKLTMSISLIKLQLQHIELDFKSEYLFRTFSVATDLVTSHQFHSKLCYYAVPFLANYGAIPYSLIFTSIAALRQAVVQANTEPFRNGLVEKKSRTVKTSTNHKTGPKWSEMIMEKRFWPWNLNFCTIFCNHTNFVLFFSNYGKMFDLLFILVFIVSERE